MKTPLQSIIECIDLATEYSGRLISWLVLIMVLLISYDVIMRYLFQQGSVALQELEWHLFALLFLLSGAYTLKHDAHVRVDVFYQSRFVTDKGRAWINIFGTVFMLMPFCIMVLFTSAPFIEYAFHHQEGSPDPGGLPHRFILKSAIFIGFAMLLLQGIAELLKNIEKLQQLESK